MYSLYPLKTVTTSVHAGKFACNYAYPQYIYPDFARSIRPVLYGYPFHYSNSWLSPYLHSVYPTARQPFLPRDSYTPSDEGFYLFEDHSRQKVKHDFIPGENVTVWRVPNKNAFFFISKMAIDADGSPRAYHPRNIGLDDLKNAGRPGQWWGIATDTGRPNGNPIIQKTTDPAPGYYVSPTTLYDASKKRTDPTAYVNSETVPYLVLPQNKLMGTRIGDIGVVINLLNNKMAYAVFADFGPRNKIGEGSIALAKLLGINPNPRTGGIEEKKILYVVFPKSGAGQGSIPSLEEINQKGKMLFEEWGGMEQVKTVL